MEGNCKVNLPLQRCTFQKQINLILFCFLSRWIKFEEDVEEGGDRWSKPHVATISLHSLFELRSCILNGTVMLDLEASSLDQIAGNVFIFSFFLCSSKTSATYLVNQF